MTICSRASPIRLRRSRICRRLCRLNWPETTEVWPMLAMRPMRSIRSGVCWVESCINR